MGAESETKMSELTPCNYCSFRSSARVVLAKAEGKTVRLIESKDEEMSGWKALEIDGEEVAWYMEMTDYCVC